MKSRKLKELKKAIHDSIPVGAAADMLHGTNPIEDHVRVRNLAAKIVNAASVLPSNISFMHPELQKRWAKTQTRNKNILHSNNPNA